MARNNQNGFSMIELLIAMALFVVVIVSATNVFIPMLTASKQQSAISETYIEGIIGLDIMRRDIEHAGIGLAWDLDGATYAEAVNAGTPTTQDEEAYNDATSDVPRKIVSGDADGERTTDVIVIKSVLVSADEASQKWTHVNSDNISQEWLPAHERLETGDRVIVIAPGVNRKLIRTTGGAFFTTYNNDSSDAPATDDTLTNTDLLPTDPDRHYIVYGVDPDTDLWMPFNRADFYVRRPPADTDPLWPMPSRCAPVTGILVKGIVDHANGGLNELPLLDCVADMQVAYGYDHDANDDTDLRFTDDFSLAPISLTNAEQVRTIKQVRVYVLAQEGQRDPGFAYANNSITVGETVGTDNPSASYPVGRAFDMTTITDGGNDTYLQYRWKLHIIVIDLTG